MKKEYIVLIVFAAIAYFFLSSKTAGAASSGGKFPYISALPGKLPISLKGLSNLKKTGLDILNWFSGSASKAAEDAIRKDTSTYSNTPSGGGASVASASR